MKKPILYGAEWCPKTSGFRNYLQSSWIDFEYKDIENDPVAEQEVKDMNGGKVKFPMVVVGEKQLKNPPITDLNQALKEAGLL
jgi:mycoredoxin